MHCCCYYRTTCSHTVEGPRNRKIKWRVTLHIPMRFDWNKVFKSTEVCLRYWIQNWHCFVSHVSCGTSEWVGCESYVQLRWLNLEENVNYKVLKEDPGRIFSTFRFYLFILLISQLSGGFYSTLLYSLPFKTLFLMSLSIPFAIFLIIPSLDLFTF